MEELKHVNRVNDRMVTLAGGVECKSQWTRTIYRGNSDGGRSENRAIERTNEQTNERTNDIFFLSKNKVR
jgi:hypothetical protein